MIKAVLLDLDNTLLDNPQDVFVRQYLKAVDSYFEEKWQQTVSDSLLRSVKAMMDVRDMRHTNTDIVLKLISKELGRPEQEISALFDEFYQTIYPSLRRFTHPFNWAVDLINQLHEQQLAVVIATNPVYPTEAIRQRLAWAGLPDTLDYYDLVTHADNMHFAKPDPAYYAEILAHIKVESDEALMVGDSFDSDIVPAATVGLHTYHVKTSGMGDGMGTLQDFYTLICSDHWTDSFLARPLSAGMIEPEMRGNLGALFGMLSEVKQYYWHQHPDPNEWSIMQIICHLLESEQTVQRPRLQRILDEDNPFIVAPRNPPGPEVDGPGREPLRQ